MLPLGLPRRNFPLILGNEYEYQVATDSRVPLRRGRTRLGPGEPASPGEFREPWRQYGVGRGIQYSEQPGIPGRLGKRQALAADRESGCRPSARLRACLRESHPADRVPDRLGPHESHEPENRQGGLAHGPRGTDVRRRLVWLPGRSSRIKGRLRLGDEIGGAEGARGGDSPEHPARDVLLHRRVRDRRPHGHAPHGRAEAVGGRRAAGRRHPGLGQDQRQDGECQAGAGFPGRHLALHPRSRSGG